MEKLAIIDKPPVKCVIEELEKALEKARNGEILGIVTIYSYNDNCTSHGWAGVENNATRITGELMCAATSLAGHIERSQE